MTNPEIFGFIAIIDFKLLICKICLQTEKPKETVKK